MADDRTIVIVGGVAGGATAAARARRCNETATIVILEKDGYVSFANCGLPYYIGGEIQERDKLLVTPVERFKERFNVEVRTHHEAMGLDRGDKKLKVRNRDTNEEYEQAYDKLILAPGATPIVPPMEGADSANVFVLRNMEDTDAIKEYLDNNTVEHPVVVGAGYIGLEMVEQLQHRGLKPTLIELSPQVLPVLDPDIAIFVEEELRAQGVELHLGTALGGFETSDGRVTTAVLENGMKLSADAVILGMGVRPNTSFAKEAGLTLGEQGGITVNGHMQTSDEDIYAVGDAVEYPYSFAGQPWRVALAGPANRAGRIAGEHAAADHALIMATVQATSVVRVFGKTAASTGLGEKLAEKVGIEAKAIVISAGHHVGYYPGAETMFLKLVYSPNDGRVLGAQAVGGAGVDKRIDVIATTLHFGGRVHDLIGVDLCYAPPFGAAKDPIHMAAFVAQNDLDGLDIMLAANANLEGKQVLDVRTPAEVKEFAIPGAINIPIDELRERIDEVDKRKPTVVMCGIGMRAHAGACMLKGQGFEEVKNLSGGMTMRRRVKPDSVEKGEN